MAEPYIATVVLTGLCYLVNGTGKVSVVMPNGMAGTPISATSSIPPHYAFIKYLESQSAPADGSPRRKADFTFTSREDPAVRWGVIILHNETVAFETNGTKLEVNSAPNAKPGGTICSTCKVPPIIRKELDDRQPYSMIVKRKTACPRCTDLPSSHLNPVKNDMFVLARLEITNGFLASGATKHKLCHWLFRPQEKTDKEPAPMLLPQMAAVDVQVLDNVLTISFANFDTSTPPPVKLQGTDTSRLVVIMGNAPLSDILELTHDPADEEFDEHFQLYYKLIAKKFAGHPFPHKDKTDSECAKITIRHGNCPPMQQ
jgi:hypothetical protein